MVKQKQECKSQQQKKDYSKLKEHDLYILLYWGRITYPEYIQYANN